jgi:hypothetical protein
MTSRRTPGADERTVVCHACGKIHRRPEGFHYRELVIQAPDGNSYPVLGCPACASDVNRIKTAYRAIMAAYGQLGAPADPGPWDAFRAANWPSESR